MTQLAGALLTFDQGATMTSQFEIGNDKPGDGNAEDKKRYPWAKYFMAAAVRGLRATHEEYLLTAIPALWRHSSVARSELTRGRGLEYAREPDVCAAIAREFRRSNLAAGVWVSGGGRVRSGLRHWDLQLEEPFSLTTGAGGADSGDGAGAYGKVSTKRVDISVTRYETPTHGFQSAFARCCRRLGRVMRRTPVAYAPVLIEAKRVQTCTTNSMTRGVPNVGTVKSQCEEIAKDVGKLRDIRAQWGDRSEPARFAGAPKPYLCLLLWHGCATQDNKVSDDDSPNGVLDAIRKELPKPHETALLELRATDWFPTDWQHEHGKGLTVKRIAWVALIEVDPPPAASS